MYVCIRIYVCTYFNLKKKKNNDSMHLCDVYKQRIIGRYNLFGLGIPKIPVPVLSKIVSSMVLLSVVIGLFKKNSLVIIFQFKNNLSGCSTPCKL